MNSSASESDPCLLVPSNEEDVQLLQGLREHHEYLRKQRTNTASPDQEFLLGIAKHDNLLSRPSTSDHEEQLWQDLRQHHAQLRKQRSSDTAPTQPDQEFLLSCDSTSEHIFSQELLINKNGHIYAPILGKDEGSDYSFPDADKISPGRRRMCFRRPTSPACRKTLKYSILAIIVIFLSLLTAIFGGAHREERLMKQAPPTLNLYSSDAAVCALNVSDSNSTSTFESVDSAHQARMYVAHCGNCGACSTYQDMMLYAGTRNTLTDAAFRCGVQSFLGLKRVSKCLDRLVGFTTDCQQCWTKNIACTRANCKWTCLKYKLLGESNNDDDGHLNPCLECDERMCGPGFLQCAGANRRQCGIISDIERNQTHEQCSSVDIYWAKLTS